MHAKGKSPEGVQPSCFQRGRRFSFWIASLWNGTDLHNFSNSLHITVSEATLVLSSGPLTWILMLDLIRDPILPPSVPVDSELQALVESQYTMMPVKFSRFWEASKRFSLNSN